MIWSGVSKMNGFWICLGWWLCFVVGLFLLFVLFYLTFKTKNKESPVQILIHLKKKLNSKVGERGQSWYFPFQRGTLGWVLCCINAVSWVINLQRSCRLTATPRHGSAPTQGLWHPLLRAAGVPAAAIPAQLGLRKGHARTQVMDRAAFRMRMGWSW